MQISDLLLILRRYWWPLILLPVIAVSAAYAARPAKSWAATESLQVLPAGPVTNISSQGVQYLIPPVVARLQARQFAEEASATLPARAADAPVKIGVNGDTATGLLTITATSTDSGAVAPWANAYGSYLVANPGSVSGLASISIIENAVQPQSPEHSSLKAELLGAGLLGLVLGLLASLGYGFYRAQQSDPDLAKSRFGASVLVRLPTVRRRQRGDWTGSALLSTPAIHELSMRLELAQVERSASRPSRGGRRTVAVLSEKRGDGRSEVTNALACEVCQSGQRVAVVYADVGGERPRIGHDFSRVRGTRSTRQWPTPYYLDEERSSSELILSALPALLKAIEPRYDLVLVDAPPLAEGADGAVVAVLAGAVVWVTAPRRDRHGMRRRIAELSGRGVDVLGIVFNRPPGLIQRFLHPSVRGHRGRATPFRADDLFEPEYEQEQADVTPSPPPAPNLRQTGGPAPRSGAPSSVASSPGKPAAPPTGPGQASSGL